MAAFPGIGDEFGRYRIVRELGRGGMGAVYEARDPSLNRSVALKVILPSLSGDADFRLRFEREAAVLARIRSRHIVAILEYGEHDGLLFLVTQYLPDGDLQTWLDTRGPLDTRTAVTLVSQLCEALGDAHEIGVVHRDVKPSNVLLWQRPDGRLVAYLCDFGIATDGDVRLTQAGAVIGSPGFMPPERHLGDPADVRGDVYAVGCMLHAVLTGAAPYTGSGMELLAAHLHAPIPQLAERSAADARLNGLLRWLMAKNPIDRPGSTAEVARELDSVTRLLDSAPPTVVPAGRTLAAPPGPPPAYPPPYRPAPAGSGGGRPRIVAVVAAVTVLVLAAVVGVVVLVGRDDDDPPVTSSEPPTSETGTTTTTEPRVETGDPGRFEPGSRMAQLAEGGTVTVGVRFDQPGLGFLSPTQQVPTGFDVEIAKLLVADLGLDPEAANAVEYVETISTNREPFLESGTVDLVVATYSITDERRAVVGQAGPYLVTGQQVLVPAASDVASIDDLTGERVCSVEGSTSLANVAASGAVAVPDDSYGSCVDRVLDGSVSAVSTDGTILLGLAAQSGGELKVVGEPFTDERLGIGYSSETPEMCQWISGVLERSFDDGSWAAAYDRTLGPGGGPAPTPPALDPC